MNMKITFLIFLCVHVFFRTNAQTNYADSANWAVLPGAYPEQLMEFARLDSAYTEVDVFYVYPTLLLEKKDKRWNVPVEDTLQQKKVLDMAVKYQASAWASAGNVYVPFYRQAHIRSYYNLENGGKDALLLAYSDVKAAFQYYLEHYNKGKGIILAGHSQGGTHISLLLEEFFDGGALQKQLVAAYMPGIGIDGERYDSLKLMTFSDQTGGYVTWNTFKKRFDRKQYKWYKGREVINPVSWDNKVLSERNEHKGFLFWNGKFYTNCFSTHLANGVIWISRPKFPFWYMSFTLRNYHLGDVNLFWEDIRVNAVLRSRVYLRNKQG
jgi:hypothetical protein